MYIAPSNKQMHDVIKRQVEQRQYSVGNIGLKINLYRGYEVSALADAIELLINNGITTKSPIESVMVGDSYLTTHLGKDTTMLSTKKEQDWGLDIMISLIKEVREAMELHFSQKNKPYLIGDMPDGSFKSSKIALQSAASMMAAGADAIKVEVTSNKALDIIQELCRNNFNVLAHIGYTPQNGILKRYGNSTSGADLVFSLCRKLRDYGVLSIVLEMINEIVNQCLCKNSENMLQIYSIFSGKAKYGGQCLNIWDSVFKPSSRRKYFPPTAEYDFSEYPDRYTKEVITPKIYELIKLTLCGEFPKSPLSSISEKESKILLAMDPWQN